MNRYITSIFFSLISTSIFSQISEMDSLMLALEGNLDSLNVIHQTRIYFDSTSNLLAELEKGFDRFNSILNEYDSLAHQGILETTLF